MSVEAVLQVALKFVNESTFKDQPLSYKDLDKLSKEQFFAILQTLLDSFQLEGSETVRACTTSCHLASLNEFHLGDQIYFDTSALEIYKQLSKCFPPDYDLNMYVLLAPSIYKDETKDLIASLASFILFGDQVQGRFNDEWDRFHKENTEKSTLSAQIEDNKDAISARVLELNLQEKQREEGLLQLAELEAEIQNERDEMAELESETLKYKKTYDYEVKVSSEFQYALDNVQQDIRTLQSQLVLSPEKLMDALEKEKNALASEVRKRENLGVKCKQTDDEKIKIEKIVREAISAEERTHKLISSLKEIETLIQQNEEMMKTVEFTDHGIESLMAELDKSTVFLRNLKLKISEKLENHSTFLKSIKRQQSELTEEIKKSKHGKARATMSTLEAQNAINDTETEIEAILEELKENEDFVKECALSMEQLTLRCRASFQNVQEFTESVVKSLP